MVNTETRFKNWTRSIFIILIIISSIFLLIFAMLGLRVNSEMTCGRDNFGSHPNAALQNHSHDLDNTGDYVLEEFKLNYTDYEMFTFCFSVYCVNTNGARINIIDEDLNILASEFALQGLGRYCTELYNLTDHNYIGLNCPTCINAANECKIQDVIAGDLKKHVENDASSVNVFLDEELSYELYAYKSCKLTIKWFLWAYIGTLMGIFLILLILVGGKKFEKYLFEDLAKMKEN